MADTKIFSRTDLTRRTREILELVRSGRPALIESYGEEQAILLDPLDFKLLRVLADLGTGRQAGTESLHDLLRQYLRGEVSLGRLAAVLDVSRFELMERFHRLDIPLKQGPVDLEDALSEAEEALKEG